MTCGRGGRLFGRGSSDRHAYELSYAGIPILLVRTSILVSSETVYTYYYTTSR